MFKKILQKLTASSYESIKANKAYSTFDVWLMEKLKWIGMHKSYYISFPIINLLAYGIYSLSKDKDKTKEFVAYNLNSNTNKLKNIIAMNFVNTSVPSLAIDTTLISASAYYLEKKFGSATVFKTSFICLFASYVLLAAIAQFRAQILKKKEKPDDKLYYSGSHGMAVGLATFALLSLGMRKAWLIPIALTDALLYKNKVYGHGGYLGGLSSWLIF